MKRLFLTLAATSALAMPSSAFAQFSADSSADTLLLADETFSSNGKITLIGQADIRQGDVRLLADKVEIYTAGGQGGGLVSAEGITRIVATGNFYYITPEQEVRGKKGVYTKVDDSFEVTGDVILLQDDSVVTGNRLKYNLTTREAKVLGDCKGRKCGTKRRVAILIRSTDNAQGTN
jgi:lipopolysaccharide export system protein LptA